MIKTFKHKGLKRFFESGSKSGIQAKHALKLRMQLTAIDTATAIEDLELPSYIQPLRIKRQSVGNMVNHSKGKLAYNL